MSHKCKIYIKNLCFGFLFLPVFLYATQQSCQFSFLNTIQSKKPFKVLLNRSHVRVKKAVWKVNVSHPSSTHSGTGFFISPDMFISNFHVVTAFGNIDVSHIHLSKEGQPHTLKVKQILDLSALHDLALLEVAQPVDSYLKIRKKPLKESDDLFVTGYFNEELQTIGKIKGRTLLSDYTYSFGLNYDGDPFGLSGSPVTDRVGKVAGVVFSGEPRSINSVNLSDLQSFISKEHQLNCRKMKCEEEVRKLTESAEQGNPYAQLHLAFFYYFGEAGLEKSFEQMAYWLKRSAENGYSVAQFHLGLMYFYSKRADGKAKGIYWLRKSAQQGYLKAQLRLNDLLKQK